nr:hypothetical protein [Tanacetum cinerariifolium]
MFKDMVSLLEAAEVFRKDNAEGEKWKKNNHAEEKDAQQPDQTKGEQISRANITDIVQGKQPSAQVVLNEKAMIVHNLEEKKEGNVSTEDDSDDDDLDKQPLSKRFKIMTLIPNPIPLNTFVPKHYQKPEEQQNLFIISPIGCFSEWLEVHALASKKTGKLNDMLLQSLRVKFQWVMDQAKKLGLPPPPALATFRMTPEEKKRKRT